MDEDDVDYRELTVSEERAYNSFINDPDLMKYMVRWPALIVKKYYVMKYKDDYDDPHEEPTIMLVGYFLGIDNRRGHRPHLVFSRDNNITLQNYYSMNTPRLFAENNIIIRLLSFEDEFFDMDRFLNESRTPPKKSSSLRRSKRIRDSFLKGGKNKSTSRRKKR